MRRVLLLGSTGLVGRELLTMLLDDPTISHVTTIVRRASGVPHPKLAEHVIPMTELDRHASLFAVDQIFCALGTTIKVAGSQEAFRFVDHDLPVTAARLGRANGATHYLLVSALGANASSRIFYNRVKGETERDVIAAGFPSVTIAQPSLLLGDRKERRLGEDLAKPFGWLMPPKYKPIHVRDVARALVEAARVNAPGVRVLESREMRR
ncbi:MAG TPA: oxidoreductase [Thermoanaerobaculia bacterium]